MQCLKLSSRLARDGNGTKMAENRPFGHILLIDNQMLAEYGKGDRESDHPDNRLENFQSVSFFSPLRVVIPGKIRTFASYLFRNGSWLLM